MTDSNEHITLEELLANAIDQTNGQFSYANNVRVSLSPNEVILDLYFMSPDPTNKTNLPVAHRINRIVLPIGIAKEAAEIIVGLVGQWEESIGSTIPVATSQNINDEE